MYKDEHSCYDSLMNIKNFTSNVERKVKMNWLEEVFKRKEEIIQETQSFLRIKSVLDEETKDLGTPFGKGIQEALHYLLEKGNRDGFGTKNVDGYAGHIEMGEGKELVGILCHIDVVPEGDGWSVDPFGAEIHDGKIYARGALDDKGPTMAVYFAMKIVKELNLPLSKRVRMIIGTDEESEWRCVDHYFKQEEMPTIGFAPDADFPIIYAEKGIIDVKLSVHLHHLSGNGKTMLTSFQAGRRFNMVPDYAKAILKNGEHKVDIETSFKTFLQNEGVNGVVKVQNNNLILELEGISAHAMEPNNGVNAGMLLAKFLQRQDLDEKGKYFVDWLVTHFQHDTRGKALQIAFHDHISGDLTVNVGIIRYKEDGENEIGINIRYPVTQMGEEIHQRLKKLENATITHFSDSKPHFVDKQHPLIQTLKRVYEEQTGEEAKLISIGGGTYARALKAGVAFGPLFPGREDVVHQKDEYIYIDDLLKATAIYAQAIYELAK
jgi:succinyl-diaminopimelate desuccinylase